MEKWESHTDIPVWEIQPVSDYTMQAIISKCKTFKRNFKSATIFVYLSFQNALIEKIVVTDLMVLLRFMVAMILIMGQMLGNGVGNPVVYVVLTVRTIIHYGYYVVLTTLFEYIFILLFYPYKSFFL